ncbi:MAG: RIP metalloprotease RseP [Selenomonadaceae bacterium]
MLTTVLASILVFAFLVLIHEFGHFILAKSTGMRVDEFAIGFGPRLVSYKYGETVYSIRIVPLGGFNDIAGMDPEENDAGDRGYCEKPLLSRIVVILAGPFMNLLLPVFIFFMLFMCVGISTPSTLPEIGDVMPDKPAAVAGLQSGDVIDRINGIDVKTWNDLTDIIVAEGNTPMNVEYHRGDEHLSTTLVPAYDKSAQKPMIGITNATELRQPGLIEAIGYAFYKTGFVIYKMLEGLVLIFNGSAAADLAGPLGVVKMTGEVAKFGFAALMNFAAFLSLNLGIVNLLPIPALDGGHFATLLLEGLRGKPLSPKAFRYTQMVGISLLVLIMLFATKNDIMRIFFGS